MSRILGLALVLVLIGVFSFVAYRKYNESRLTPQTAADATSANPDGSAIVGQAPADSAGQAPAQSGAQAGESRGGSAFEQSASPDAPFHPTSGGSSGRLSAGEEAPGHAGMSPQTPSREAEVNPFSDVATNGPGSGGANAKTARSSTGQSAPASKSTASGEAPGDQAEPFFDDAPQKPAATGRPGWQSGPIASRKQAGMSAQVFLANEHAENSAGGPQDGSGLHYSGGPPSGGSAGPAAVRRPLQTARIDESTQPRQMAESALTQGEPNQTDLNQSAPNQDGPNQNGPGQSGQGQKFVRQRETPQNNANQKQAALGDLSEGQPAANELFKQPVPTAQSPGQADRSSFAPRSAPPSSGPQQNELIDLDETPKTASTATSAPGFTSRRAQATAPVPVQTSPVQASPVQPPQTGTASDGEDLFAGKTADATPHAGSAPIVQRQAAGRQGPSALHPSGGTGMEAALNDAEDVYVVEPQDTFWTISRKRYGTARYFRALAEINKQHVPDPTRMRPGTRIRTPATEILETQFAQYLPRGSTIEVASGERQPATPRSTGFFVNSAGKPMYRTGDRDTLSVIAARHLGRASRWTEVFELNRDKLASPNQLKIGLELALPADASNVGLTNDASERR